MAIDEEKVISLVEDVLGLVGDAVGGVAGGALSAASQLVRPLAEAMRTGQAPEQVVLAVKMAIVAASDRDMKAELGP